MTIYYSLQLISINIVAKVRLGYNNLISINMLGQHVLKPKYLTADSNHSADAPRTIENYLARLNKI